jgi:hypothetical protein
VPLFAWPTNYLLCSLGLDCICMCSPNNVTVVGLDIRELQVGGAVKVKVKHLDLVASCQLPASVYMKKRMLNINNLDEVLQAFLLSPPPPPPPNSLCFFLPPFLVVVVVVVAAVVVVVVVVVVGSLLYIKL